jgi:outer membrane receptor protein involved in Fe transport
LFANVALNAGYYKTWQGNISLTDNLAVTAADFTPYCITAPADPRLPEGGRYPVCGLYDVSPAKFGQVQNLVTFAPHRSNTFDGFDGSLSARFGNGGMLRAGFASGQTVIDNCETPDVPPQFCRRTVPFRAQTDLKVSVVYPLQWWQLQASAVYQNLPGVPRAASYVAANAEIAPSLGGNLASCPNAIGPCDATAVVDLVEPNTLFEPRGSQLDLRLSKIFQFGRGRLQANVDVYNATNASDVLALNNRYGPQWWNAIGILTGRVWKFSAQFDF